MTVPTLPSEPKSSGAITGEHHLCIPGAHCPVNPAVAKRGWVTGVANRRTIAALVGAGTLFAGSTVVAWTLAGNAADAAASAMTAHEVRQSEDRRAVAKQLDRIEGKLDRYLGPMAPMPMVREPGP